MNVSAKGMIDILAHEALSQVWYLDSVGVATIGAGETRADGTDPRSLGTLSIGEIILRFKTRIKPYDEAVQAIGLPFTQYQHDALTSCCYNFGQGNLRQLCHHRTIEQIGAAIMLYLKPPEIRKRRIEEQRLYIHGEYANTNGEVLVFPVSSSHHPLYHQGHMIDVRPYFNEGATS